MKLSLIIGLIILVVGAIFVPIPQPPQGVVCAEMHPPVCKEYGWRWGPSLWQKWTQMNDSVSRTPSSNSPPQEPTPTAEVPFTANFEIYTQGTKRDFSSAKYHNQSKDAYMETSKPTQVIVKKSGVTWQQFFDTLPSPFKLTKECLYTGTGQTFCSGQKGSLAFELNGKATPDSLDLLIKPNDRLVISFK